MIKAIKLVILMAKLFDIEPYAGWLAQTENRHTKRDRECDLRKLKEFLDEKSVTPTTVTKTQLLHYCSWLSSKNLSRNTVLHVRTTARKFFHYLFALDFIPNDIAIVFSVQTLRKTKPIKRALSEVARLKLLSSMLFTGHIEDPELFDFRGSLVVLLGLHCALRVSEMCRVKLTDFSFITKDFKFLPFDQAHPENNTLFIGDSKGGEDVEIPVSKSLYLTLWRYKGAYEQRYGWFKHPENPFLFPSHRPRGHKHMEESTAQRLLKRVALRAKLTEPISVHDLRHTCGTVLNDSGARPEEIQYVMRHASIAITMDTYVKKNKAKIALSYQKAFA